MVWLLFWFLMHGLAVSCLASWPLRKIPGAEVRVKSLDPSSLEEMQVLAAFVACWNAGV